MINNLLICKLAQTDKKPAYQVFQASISDAFEKEGLGFYKEDIDREISRKRHLLDLSLEGPDPDIFFLAAKLGENVIGTISYGPCSEDIKKCARNELGSIGELGSLYILPQYQDQGVGAALIKAMMDYLLGQGIERFCLDSGYKRAQKRWLRKFGVPYKVVKDYWGEGSDNMIWVCKTADFSCQDIGT